MKNTNYLKLGFLFLFVFFFTGIKAQNSAVKTPNVIVILADDIGYADVGFQENTALGIQTPNLDKLAKKGIVFNNAYASAAVCSNSRLGLSTGRYQQRWGAYYYNQGGLPSNEFTIAEMMREAGYKTMKVGKTHLNGGPKSDPMKHGFDHWLGFKSHSYDYFLLSQKDVDAYNKKYPGSAAKAKMIPFGPLVRDSKTVESFENTNTTEVFTNESVKFIESANEKPFYLQLEYNALHTPLYKAPEVMRKKYAIPTRSFNRDDKVWEYPHWDPIIEPDYSKWYSETCHLGIADPYGRKIYLAHLEYMDMMIGKIVKALKKKGILDNTIIVFSSDNGGSNQSYANNLPINSYKYCLMDGGIKVPMFIHWPEGIAKNKKVDALITHRDLYASLSELTGIAPKKKLDGKSLFPLFKGGEKEIHNEPLFWDSGDKEKNWVVRSNNWKLVYRNESKNYASYVLDKKGLVTGLTEEPIPAGYQLYDLNKDPYETQNIASVNTAKVAEMKKLYTDWRAQMGKPIRGSKAK
ncbi:sulfatase-like hydrolase/transferase [Polaribacter sp. Z014]|uniref:sulfatase family protein n=1 Tax=Polaribacter sp. Z014 TaxID=2927126 RepID=UPI0020215030|nr:sulfatase-like hydrolase/transferase [Polaribacter sp. Z014]MCL7763976.1 sulfatase-like hydrolase/transferase [Polaribacter sp. Z014]